jgi:hypothetical protein
MYVYMPLLYKRDKLNRLITRELLSGFKNSAAELTKINATFKLLLDEFCLLKTHISTFLCK